jgi:alkylation response protein AidB-like acyl-CoA dehydrogenase
VDLNFTADELAFGREVRAWLRGALSGRFAALRGRGGPGDEASLLDERAAWERHLGESGWIGLGWPAAEGGRGASFVEQMIFHEAYAEAEAPGRLGHIGEMLLAPTLIAFADRTLKERFLPGIRAGEVLWCQGYSEPNAGSDLANVQTRARLEADGWHLDGQKVWTSHAEWSDWCFVVCRTEADSARHRGLSYLLVPMKQPGVTVRPIHQATGTAEFSEVFFDDARTAADNVVGARGDGWRVAMGTLGFERGVSTLGQQATFRAELRALVVAARANGRLDDPLVRDRLAKAAMGLEVQRLSALRLFGAPGPLPAEAMVSKLTWATWHRDLGELAMDVLGEDGLLCDGSMERPYLSPLQRLFVFSRADTIYAGTNQIQRNVIGERALGLPKEPR